MPRCKCAKKSKKPIKPNKKRQKRCLIHSEQNQMNKSCLEESSLINKEDKSKIYPIVDAVFLCDFTGSMGSYIEKTKEVIKEMVNELKSKYSRSSLFVGFVGYRDHCDKELIEYIDLTSDFEEINRFITNIVAKGGGDMPEAVVDGLDFASRNISWRKEESLRLLIHILDSPPHGKEFTSCKEDYPEGCPCKKSYSDILKELDSQCIKYLICKITKSIDKMIKIFKSLHKDCEEIDIIKKLEKSNLDYREKARIPLFKRRCRTKCKLSRKPTSFKSDLSKNSAIVMKKSLCKKLSKVISNKFK